MNSSELRQFLITHFNESELHDLCFDLQIDYESLQGQTKADKARQLIAYVERHGRIDELTDRIHQLRSNVNIPNIKANAKRSTKQGMSWSTINALLGLVIAAVGCLAAVIVVPEVRKVVGLDPQPAISNTANPIAAIPPDSTTVIVVHSITPSIETTLPANLPDPTFTPEATSTIPQPTPTVNNSPTKTSVTPTTTPELANTPELPTATPTETLSPTSDIPVLNVGDTFTDQQGLATTLQSYGIGEGGIGITLRFANHSNKDILLRYHQSQFEVVDDTGQSYNSPGMDNPKQLTLTPGASVDIASNGNQFTTGQFDRIGTFNGIASENAKFLYLNLYQFMGTSKITWRIADLDPITDQPQAPASGAIQNVGQTFTGGGLSLRLDKLDIGTNGIFLSFTVRNVSGKPILVHYRQSSIEVLDDLGGTYPSDGSTALKQYYLDSGGSITISSSSNKFLTEQYNLIGGFYGAIGTNAKSIIVRVSHFMQMRDLSWKKDI